MASNMETWQTIFRGNVYDHKVELEAQAVYHLDTLWDDWAGIDDLRREMPLGRQARRRLMNSVSFGRASRESLGSVGGVDTSTEDLPADKPIVHIFRSHSFGATEPPVELSPIGVEIVRGAQGLVATPVAGVEDVSPSSSSEIDVLISALGIYDCETVATRIQEFLTIREEEPDEPPIVRESLLSLVQFLIQEPQLLPPIVSSDPYGLMELEWHLMDNGDPNTPWGRGNGVVSLKFLKSGSIQYVALSGPKRKGHDRLRRHGSSSKCEMLFELGEFAQRITAT